MYRQCITTHTTIQLAVNNLYLSDFLLNESPLFPLYYDIFQICYYIKEEFFIKQHQLTVYFYAISVTLLLVFNILENFLPVVFGTNF